MEVLATHQMGGGVPAKVIAPLQAAAIYVELDQRRNHRRATPGRA